MSRKNSILFFCLTILLIASTSMTWGAPSWLTLIQLYLAVVFGQLAFTYGMFGPRIFGKRPDGRLPGRTWILFGPYLALSHLGWQLHRLAQGKRRYVEAAPGLYFGRRLTAREAQQPDHPAWHGVLDLTAEFSEAPRLRQLPSYRSLPILDFTAPTDSDLHIAVTWLEETLRQGPVYVHCAAGYGRSACVVIAYLLTAGIVTNVNEGEQRLRDLRPGVGLTKSQRQRLRQFERSPS